MVGLGRSGDAHNSQTIDSKAMIDLSIRTIVWMFHRLPSGTTKSRRMCRANGTDKSSEASLPFLMARLMRYWSPQLLQPRNRGIEGYEVKFQAQGVKLFMVEI